FQILNDLKDWEGDSDNKLVSGQDVLAARPTLLLALALEGSNVEERGALLSFISQCQTEHRVAKSALPNGTTSSGTDLVGRVRKLYEQAEVFDKAEKLVEKYRARAEALADEVEPTELRELLYFLVDTILDRQSTAGTQEEPPPLVQLNA